jgi:hypothetical protein
MALRILVGYGFAKRRDPFLRQECDFGTGGLLRRAPCRGSSIPSVVQ